MTQSIRDAAQAVLDAGDMIGTVGAHDRADAMRTAVARLRSALSAPQPTADERVAEHMRLVDECGKRLQEWHEFRLKADRLKYDAARKAVEQSARALLSASQEDAEHAAMYRWIRAHGEPDESLGYRVDWSNELYDAAIRAAMNAKEPK